MLKVAFSEGVNSWGDKVRGIGVHTSEFLKALKLHFGNRVKISNQVSQSDILHVTKFHPFFVSLPFQKKTKKVVLTIHDLIQLIYPKHFPPGVRGKINFLINKFLIYKNVDAIITISETSKKDICRFLGVDPEIVHVVHLAPKEIYKNIKVKYENSVVAAKYQLPKKFALYIGDVNYNKNIPLLVDACRKAKTNLVMVGSQAKKIKNLDLTHPELMHLSKVDFKNVVRLGFVPDDELVEIINLAQVYIQPSLYEGFGIPVLEALSCGTPVIASRTQSLVEIAENDCTFFDPKNMDDLVDKIKKYDVSKTKLSMNRSWKNVAEETLKIYEKI